MGHPLVGSIFETFVISECFKRISHMGEIPRLYFWRDKTGTEIDLIIDEGLKAFPIEIKLAQTPNRDFSSNLNYWLNLQGNENKRGQIIYTGERITNSTSNTPTIPWFFL